MYGLDEPSIGLHQRDNGRLLYTLKNLRDLGNSVIVVDDGCYAIQNYGKGEWGWSAWIFPEALIELQKLSPIVK